MELDALPRIIGLAKALELIMTGEPVDADEARQIGLVGRVVPSNELLKVAEELAASILRRCATRSPVW